MFNSVKMVNWGAAHEGRKTTLRLKSRVYDHFRKKEGEKQSTVAQWKCKCINFIDSFNQTTKNLKKELKSKIIPHEKKKPIPKNEILKLNQKYYDKCNFNTDAS